MQSPVSIRLALAHEGPIIQQLCVKKGARIGAWLNWEIPLASNWLIAEITQPIGCIMINYGVPIGRMEFLIVPPGLDHKTRGTVVRNLCYAAMQTLSEHGSQAVTSMVSEAEPAWSRVVQRRGAVPIATGTMFIKGI